MDLINEYEKEIKELKKQKESIEKLSEQSANLKVERDKKKQELDKIQDYKSAFYEDLSKEYSEKDSEFATSLAHEELAKRNLKRNLEEKKSKILNELEEKLAKIEKNRNSEFANLKQDEVKKLTEEKKKLEEELKLNDVTKEEWLKLPREEQIKVNHAKEQYLNNKHRLEDIEPKLEIANLYEGKTPVEKYTEIKEKIGVIDKEFTLENLDNLVGKLNQKESKENLEKDWEEEIKENEKFDRKNAIRKDLDERTEKAIAKNQDKNSEQLNNNKPQLNQPQQPNNNKPQPNPTQQSNDNKPQPNQPQQPNNNKSQLNLQQNIGQIIGIEIVEGSDKINIAKVGEDGQIENLTIENKLKEILKNKKEIFKNPEVAKIIDEVEPSKFKQYFLKRKLSPVILNVLSENKQGSGIIDYVVAIKREENCENLKIKHDLSNTVLKGRLKRMMKRVAKTEHYIDGMEVKGLKETKTMGLLESGKRKLKNKPTTIKEGFKLVGKPFKAIGKGINAIGKETKNKFRKNIEVEKSIKDKLEAVSKSFEDEDLEKLEDKEDPDLEETEPKTQEEEQEIE